LSIEEHAPVRASSDDDDDGTGNAIVVEIEVVTTH
jgi:hypothetical protein